VPVPGDIRGGRGGYANAKNRRRRTCGHREQSRQVGAGAGVVSLVSTMFCVFSTGRVSYVLAKRFQSVSKVSPKCLQSVSKVSPKCYFAKGSIDMLHVVVNLGGSIMHCLPSMLLKMEWGDETDRGDAKIRTPDFLGARLDQPELAFPFL
jgi:hypothetical protein